MNCSRCGGPIDRAHVLTSKQLTFLEKVHELKAELGRFPFPQEIRRALGFRTLENVRYHARKLAAHGWLELSHGQRGVTLIVSARSVA